MNPSQDTKLSRFLSLVLRHQPGKIGIVLDAAGWTEVNQLLAACARYGVPMDRAALNRIVAGNDKQRFAFDETGNRIRASQGHSVQVELGYAPAEPPTVLYHGTVRRFLGAIRREGLRKGRRHHVHLSPDVDAAAKVGARRGDAVVLPVDAARMSAAKFQFYRSENGVWLTDRVPPEYLTFPAESA